MDLGLFIRPVETYPAMLELSTYAEDLGLFGVFINDHLEGLPREEPYPRIMDGDNGHRP